MSPGWTALLIGLLLAAALMLGLHWLWRTRIKRRYLRTFANLLFPVPGRISLHLATNQTSRPGDRLVKRAEAFRNLGFQGLGAYTVAEIDGARLSVLVQPTDGMVAVVHHHPCLGTWSDVMRFSSQKEAPFLASNILKHAHFYFLPGDPKTHHPAAEESELVRVVSASGAHEHLYALPDASTFPRLYEKAFAEAADQRSRELFTENQIRRLLKDLSPDAELSDADIRGIRELLPEAIRQDQRKSGLWEFLAGSGISAREWQQVRGKVLVINDQDSLRQLRSCPFSACFLTPELSSQLKRTRVRTAPRPDFSSLNNALPARHRYKLLGQVEKPVPADIYRAPLKGGPS